MKKAILFASLLWLVVAMAAQPRVIELPDLMNPVTISADDNQLYITEGINIYIYSKTDFNLKRKIGKEGEGPQEFKLLQPGGFPLIIDVQTRDIIVNSLSKISFFTKSGNFQREMKATLGISGAYQPLAKGFAGIGFAQENNQVYRTIHITDEKLNKTKEVFRIEHDFQQGKGLKGVPNPYTFQTYKKKLYVAWETGFVIHVFDENGNKLYTINQEYAQLPITEDHKSRIMEYYRTAPNTRQFYDFLKNQIYFPKVFPAIRNMIITGDKIYIQTNKQNETGSEFFVLDLPGKFLQRLMLPVREQSPVVIYPYTIDNGRVLQLIENEDEEEWELHITEINP